MDAAAFFSFGSAFVLIGWVLLLFFPAWKYTENMVRYAVILTLGVLYIYLLFNGLSADFDPSAFSTLAGVKSLFGSDLALVAGWFHYLAFDLLAGLFISQKGSDAGIPRWQIVLCMPFTFMFGPVGFVLFSIFALYKKYFQSNAPLTYSRKR